MMTGYLREKLNVAITEKRVDTALSVVSPQVRAQRRTSTIKAVNLIPNSADYISHELYIDQNEN